MALELHTKQLIERILNYDEKTQQEILSSIINGKIEKAVANNSDIVALTEDTEKAVEVYKNFGKITGLSTGYGGLNHMTKGLRGGEIIVLSAKTSVGKTALSLNIATNVAKNGHPVLFLTFEMTHTEIRARYIHITGGLGDDGQPKEDYYKVGGITVLQKDEQVDWRSINGLIKKAKEQIGAELVIIDHLHYFSREISNPNEELGLITKEFKKASIQYDVPIILIAHSRKTAKGDEVQAEDVRGSSYIVQDADIVLMLNRDKDDPNIVKCTISKNRNAGIDWKNNETHFLMNATKMTEIEQW